MRLGKDGKSYFRNGEDTPELRNEIAKWWFEIRKRFNNARTEKDDS